MYSNISNQDYGLLSSKILYFQRISLSSNVVSSVFPCTALIPEACKLSCQNLKTFEIMKSACLKTSISDMPMPLR